MKTNIKKDDFTSVLKGEARHLQTLMDELKDGELTPKLLEEVRYRLIEAGDDPSRVPVMETHMMEAIINSPECEADTESVLVCLLREAICSILKLQSKNRKQNN